MVNQAHHGALAPLILLSGIACLCVSRAEELEIPDLPLWHPSVTVRNSVGYKDNLLLSHVRPEESAFAKNGLDFFLLRLPEEGPQFHFTVSGEDLRYFSGESVDAEQLVFSDASLTYEFRLGWEAILGLNYIYLNQVLDVP